MPGICALSRKISWDEFWPTFFLTPGAVKPRAGNVTGPNRDLWPVGSIFLSSRAAAAVSECPGTMSLQKAVRIAPFSLQAPLCPSATRSGADFSLPDSHTVKRAVSQAFSGTLPKCPRTNLSLPKMCKGLPPQNVQGALGCLLLSLGCPRERPNQRF